MADNGPGILPVTERKTKMNNNKTNANANANANANNANTITSTNPADLSAFGRKLIEEASEHPTWCPEVKAGRIAAGVWLKGVVSLVELRARLRHIAEAEADFREGQSWGAEEAAEHAALREVAEEAAELPQVRKRRPAANIISVYTGEGLCPRNACFAKNFHAIYLVANRAFRRASPVERRNAVDHALYELKGMYGWAPMGPIPVVMTGMHTSDNEMEVEYF